MSTDTQNQIGAASSTFVTGFQEPSPATARLILRDAQGEVAQQWLLQTSRCTLGSASGCEVVYDAPGIAPYHALIVVGARQSYVRGLAPRLTRDGVPINEVLLSGEENHFEIADARFELTMQGRPPVETDREAARQRLKFTLARPFAIQPRNLTGDSENDASLSQPPTSSTATGLPSKKMIAELVQEAMLPLECQLQNVLQPLADLRAEAAEQRELLQQQQASSANSIANAEFENAAQIANAGRNPQLESEFHQFTAKQSATMETIEERISDLNNQLSAIEQLVSTPIEAKPSEYDATNFSRETEEQTQAIQQLQDGMVSVSSAINNLEDRQANAQQEQQQWREGLQAEVTSLRDAVDTIARTTQENFESLMAQETRPVADVPSREDFSAWQGSIEEQFQQLRTSVEALSTTDSRAPNLFIENRAQNDASRTNFSEGELRNALAAVSEKPHDDPSIDVDSLTVVDFGPSRPTVTEGELRNALVEATEPAHNDDLQELGIPDPIIEGRAADFVNPGHARTAQDSVKDGIEADDASVAHVVDAAQADAEPLGAFESASTNPDFEQSALIANEAVSNEQVSGVEFPTANEDNFAAESKAPESFEASEFDFPSASENAPDFNASFDSDFNTESDESFEPAAADFGDPGNLDSSADVANSAADLETPTSSDATPTSEINRLADIDADDALLDSTPSENSDTKDGFTSTPVAEGTEAALNIDEDEFPTAGLLASAVAPSIAPSADNSNPDKAGFDFASGQDSAPVASQEAGDLPNWWTESKDLNGGSISELSHGEQNNSIQEATDTTGINAESAEEVTPANEAEEFFGLTSKSPIEAEAVAAAEQVEERQVQESDEEEFPTAENFLKDRLEQLAEGEPVSETNSVSDPKVEPEPFAASEPQVYESAEPEFAPAQTPLPEVDTTAPQPATAGGEEEDTSVEDYMKKLLARMRGVPEDEVEVPGNEPAPTASVPAPTSTANETLKSAESQNAPPSSSDLASFATASPTGEASTNAGPPPAAARAPDIEMPARRAQSPERAKSLAAMRELANSSARTAIHKSTRQRHVSGLALKSSIALIGLVVGFTLLGINGLAFNIGLVATVVAFLVAAIWGYEAVTTVRPLLQAGLVPRDNSNRAAQPASTDAADPKPEAAEGSEPQ